MFQFIRKYKSVLRFILTFLGTYILLTVVYNQYLKFGASDVYYPEYITHQVAKQTESLIGLFGYKASVEPHPTIPSMKLSVEGKYLARIVEGCNAISVMILFSSFILAFFNGWIKTFIFILVGVLLIYLMNVFRIAVIAIAIYEKPEYKELLHGVFFPGLIYGFVFLLWFIWINKFVPKKKN